MVGYTKYEKTRTVLKEVTMFVIISLAQINVAIKLCFF